MGNVVLLDGRGRICKHEYEKSNRARRAHYAGYSQHPPRVREFHPKAPS